jgi:hypothetical protein
LGDTADTGAVDPDDLSEVTYFVEDIVGDVGHTIVAVHEWELSLIPTFCNAGRDVESISGYSEQILSLIDSGGNRVLEDAQFCCGASSSFTIWTPGHLASTMVRASSVVMEGELLVGEGDAEDTEDAIEDDPGRTTELAIELTEEVGVPMVGRPIKLMAAELE